MPVDIVVPRVGEATSGVTIVRWLKGTGDWVEEGEPLFEVSLEKAIIAVEAHMAGRLIEILAKADAQVQPLDVVARLAPAAEAEAALTPKAGEQWVSAAPASAQSDTAALPPRTAPPTRAGAGQLRASPKAKRIAEELGIELIGIVGTGPGGLVSAEDVERAAAARRSGAANTQPQPAASPGSAKGGRPLSRQRQAIAKRMTLSKTTAPHFYVLRQADMSQARRLRKYLGDRTEQKPSYTAILVWACALALRDIPALNVNLRDDLVFARQTIDVGIAVALSGAQKEAVGLIVPVVREADRKSLRDLDREIDDLVERARSNRLRVQDLEMDAHSLVLSNLGQYGVDAFVPIIDPPDPMIVAAGAVAERPWVEGGQLVVRPTVTLTVAADHRVMDGAAAAGYLRRVCQILEYPYGLEGILV